MTGPQTSRIPPLPAEQASSVVADGPNGPEGSEAALPHSCRCGARWVGDAVAHCAGSCHVSFTTAGNFARHRRDGRCLHPADAGLVSHQRAGYVAYGQPASESWYHREAS